MSISTLFWVFDVGQKIPMMDKLFTRCECMLRYLSILAPVAYQTMRGETVEMQLLPEPADTRHNRCIVCIILSIL